MELNRLGLPSSFALLQNAAQTNSERTIRCGPRFSWTCIAFVLGLIFAIYLQGAAALASPAFVVQGPTVVADKCSKQLTDCVSISYPQGSPIAQSRIASVPEGNVEFDIPVISNGLNADVSLCGDIAFKVTVNVVGPNPAAGETLSLNATTSFGTSGGSVVLRIPALIDWIESAVSFNFEVSQRYLLARPPGKPGEPPVNICIADNYISGGPNLSGISLPSNLPFSVANSGFLLLVAPEAAFQIPLLPVGILYGPLGNVVAGPGTKAVSSLQLTNIVGTNQQFTNSAGTKTGTTNDDKTQYSAGINLGFKPKDSTQQNCGIVCVGFQASGSWDTSVENDNMDSYGTTGGVTTLSQQQILYTDVPAPNQPPLSGVTYSTQPFWQDYILAVTNAQYAAFDYPTGPVVEPLGSASVVALPIRQLHGCRYSSNAIEPLAVNPGPGQWAASHAYAAGSLLLDSNGDIEVASASGTSGTTPPNWNATIGGTTTDGAVTWTNEATQYAIFRDSSVQSATQYVWLQRWAENHAYPTGAVVYGYSTINVVTTPGASGANLPSWDQQIGGTTPDGSVTWTSEAPQPWSPNHSYAVGALVLDPNLDLQVVTEAGMSGASPPNWTVTTTKDGTVTWTNETPQTWTASHSYGVGVVVYGSAPFIQVATTGGTSGGAGPTWSLVAGGTTTDGTVIWTNETDHFAAYSQGNMTVWQWLSANDCANIASVDQFYWTGVQSAKPLAYRTGFAGLGVNAAGGTCYTNLQASTTTSGQTATQNYNTTVTSVVSNSDAISAGINIGDSFLNILSVGLGITGTLTQANSQTIVNSTFSNSTLQSQRSTTGQYQAQTCMQDQPPPATDIPANVLQDAIYVGMAVQVTDMSPAPPSAALQPAARAAVPAVTSLSPDLQGLPVVPVGGSDATLRRTGTLPTTYALQTPYGYLRVERPSNPLQLKAAMQASHADAGQRHKTRPLPPTPAVMLDAISPMDAVSMLGRIPSPSVPVQNAIKRLTALGSP